MASPSSSHINVALVQEIVTVHEEIVHASYHMFDMDQEAHAYAGSTYTCKYEGKELSGTVHTSDLGLVWNSIKIGDEMDSFELPRPPESKLDSVRRSNDFKRDLLSWYQVRMHALLCGKSYMCVHARKDSYMFGQGVHQFDCLFWLPRSKQIHVVHVQESSFLGIYYFSRSRPPEPEVHTGMFGWWRLFSLRQIGWGPPEIFIYLFCNDYLLK